MLDEPWGKMIQYERILGLRATAEVFAGMTALMSEEKGKCTFAPFWEALSENGFAECATLRDANKTLETFGGKTLKLRDAQLAGKKPAPSRAFSFENIELEGLPCVEIAVPVFSSSRWIGELRFIAKRWE